MKSVPFGNVNVFLCEYTFSHYSTCMVLVFFYLEEKTAIGQWDFYVSKKREKMYQ